MSASMGLSQATLVSHTPTSSTDSEPSASRRSTSSTSTTSPPTPVASIPAQTFRPKLPPFSSLPPTTSLSQDQTLNLTFGVEFEFILAFRRSSCPPDRFSSTQHDLLRREMVHTLRDAGIPVNNIPGLDYDLWAVDSDSSIDELLPPENQRNWDEREWDEYYFMNVEIKTRILVFGTAAAEEITRALSALHSKFKIFVNHSCGLHVHVGNLGPKPDFSKRDLNSVGFPLTTLQTIATLATIFNRNFNSLHPYHRVDNVHCHPHPPKFLGMHSRSMVDKIRACATVTHLAKLMSNAGGREMAYNFLPLCSVWTWYHEGRAGLNTIEFRQHEGTLDPEVVGNWLLDLVARHMGQTEEEFNIIHLLFELGLEEVGEYYAGKTLWDHPKMEWEDWDPRMDHVKRVKRDLRKEAEREMEARWWFEEVQSNGGGEPHDGDHEMETGAEIGMLSEIDEEEFWAELGCAEEGCN